MNTTEKIIELFLTNPDYRLKKIAKICEVSLATVERKIRNYSLNLSNERKPGGGRPKGPQDINLEEEMVKKMKARRFDSSRDIARKFKVSQSLVQKVKKRNQLKSCVKQKKALKTTKQFNEGINRAKELHKVLKREKKSCLIMDDETYIKKDFSQIPGKEYYIKGPGEILDESLTTIGYGKFTPKKLFWQAICECGLRSRPYLSAGNMTAEIYTQECLKKRLLPFILEHGGPTIFWPDLAAIHYARSTIQFMNDNEINFVPKSANPAAVPEDRPIEKYWALIKRELKKEPKAATNDKELKYRYQRASSRITEETVKSLMSSVRQKVYERSKLTPKEDE